MSFSNYSGIAIVPTLSRVVLCAAFIAAGYSKVFVSTKLSYEDAQILDNLGVSLTHVPPPATAPATAPAATSPPPTINPPVETPPVIEIPPATVPEEVTPIEPPPVETPPFTITPSPAEEPSTPPPTTEPEVEPAPESPSDPPPSAHMNATIVLAAYQQPQPAQPRSPGRLKRASASSQPVAEPMPPTKQPAALQPAKQPAAPPAKPTPKQASSITAPPLPPGTYQAKNMHQITVMLANRGWSYPKGLAIAAAYTELLGGALLLIGLFSRLCGLGLAGVMVVAFYLTSLNPLLDAHFMLLSMKPFEMSTMFLQLALFVLAFGVFLTGPGPLSIDRFLFGSPREVIEVDQSTETS